MTTAVTTTLSVKSSNSGLTFVYRDRAIIVRRIWPNVAAIVNDFNQVHFMVAPDGMMQELMMLKLRRDAQINQSGMIAERSGREFYFKLSPIVKARSVMIMEAMIKGLPIILNDYIRGHELLQGFREGKKETYECLSRWCSYYLVSRVQVDVAKWSGQAGWQKIKIGWIRILLIVTKKELPLQIAKDRKTDRAYIPPLNLFEDHSHNDSFYSDEENFEGLDYEDAHLGFDPEKSLKFHYLIL
ncbi:hypothetical protein Tco_0700781 [Tanacetum coccineum]